MINLKAAKVLGLEVPPTPLLARADEVIDAGQAEPDLFAAHGHWP